MILSVHIPKTAGVSIRNTLKEHFGPGFVLCYWEVTDAWGRVLPEVPVTAECVHGHFQADLLASRFPQARLITWVRDPVERVASSYFHRLREPDWKHPVCHELHSRKLSLAQFAALPLVRNEMAHFFGQRQPADYAFVGIVERYEESFRQLRTLLGIGPAPLRRDNVNPAKPAPAYEIDPATRAEIRKHNEDDLRLYEKCLDWANRTYLRAGGGPAPDGVVG